MGIGKSKIPEHLERATTLRRWMDMEFWQLPPEGREELLKFAREKKYKNDVRSFEFWFGICSDSVRSDFLSTYLEDGDGQLLDVKPNDDDIDGIIEQTKNVESFLNDMKDRMAPRLHQVFKEFRVECEKKVKELEKSKS